MALFSERERLEQTLTQKLQLRVLEIVACSTVDGKVKYSKLKFSILLSRGVKIFQNFLGANSITKTHKYDQPRGLVVRVSDY